jgi:hypothetical protein
MARASSSKRSRAACREARLGLGLVIGGFGFGFGRPPVLGLAARDLGEQRQALGAGVDVRGHDPALAVHQLSIGKRRQHGFAEASRGRVHGRAI